MPDAFVPFAEQTGFIRRLTRWALDKAAAGLLDATDILRSPHFGS